MHSLLKRQIRKHYGEMAGIPPEWQLFVDSVGKAYEQFDEDRKMLERALDLSSNELVQANSQMRAVFEAFPDLFFLINKEGLILEFNNNSRSEDFFPVSEIVGRFIQDLPSAEASAGFRKVVEALQNKKLPIGIEYTLPIGEQLEYYEARALSLPEEKSLVIVRNISIRKRAEKALENNRSLLEETVEKRTSELRLTNASLEREIQERKRVELTLKKTEAQFRTLVEQLPSIIYIMEARESQRWLYISPQIAPMLGLTPEGWILNPELAKEHLHPEDRERVLSERQRCFQQGETFECEYRLASKKGRYVWCRDEAALVIDEESNERYFQGVILDITERKNLEDQLRQSMKLEAIGRLAGGIAHDFNNILTAVILDAHLIKDVLKKEHSASEYVDGILTSAERAAALTQQLLAYSRRQTLQPKVFDVHELINNLKGMLKRLIGEHIEMETFSFGRAFILADPGQIEQVIINLLVNARDAMPKGGKVRIDIERERIDENSSSIVPIAGLGDYIRIKVKDNGMGISERDLSHIFEPFFTTKAQGKGTGLGLATSYGIIKQSGGSISVESTPGEGTTFTIYLQEVEEEVNPTPPPPTNLLRNLSKGQETILVAEDEPMVRLLAAQVLRKLGYKVIEASNGEEALSLFNDAAPRSINLLLTDMVMPRMGGKDLAEKVYALQPSLKIIYMSGYSPETLGNNEAFLKGTAFLQKPFTPNSLAQKLREAFHNGAPGSLKNDPL